MGGVVDAFTANGPSTALRSSTSLGMSHFSTIQTKLANKDILLKTLQQIGLKVSLDADVRGYRGETIEADLAIAQENGHDIGFRYNGETYELVSDLQFWQQSVPVDVFLNKVNQNYSVNSVLESASEDGFTVDSKVT